jgi:endonuclease G
MPRPPSTPVRRGTKKGIARKSAKARRAPTKGENGARELRIHRVPAAPGALDDESRARLAARAEELQDTYRAVLATFGHRANVTGVDVGFRRKGGRWTEQLVVRIHVREKVDRRDLGAREVFPLKVNGVPIDVVPTPLANHDDLSDRFVRRDPIQPGISVSPAGRPGGTLGALMYDAVRNETCLLSAAHVLFPDSASVAGGDVVQPSWSHGGVADGFSYLTRFDPFTDAAIARIGTSAPEARLVSGVAFGTGVELSDCMEPYHGQLLRKSGAGTSVTTAIVDGIGSYEGLDDAFTLLPVVGGEAVITRAGDSGAVWFDAQSGHAVGLHCKGPLNPSAGHSYAVATRFSRVMKNLQLSFVSFS